MKDGAMSGSVKVHGIKVFCYNTLNGVRPKVWSGIKRLRYKEWFEGPDLTLLRNTPAKLVQGTADATHDPDPFRACRVRACMTISRRTFLSLAGSTAIGIKTGQAFSFASEGPRFAHVAANRDANGLYVFLRLVTGSGDCCISFLPKNPLH